MEEIAPGTWWVHNREGYSVRVVALDGDPPIKVKDADDARWQAAVAYRRDDEDTVFVRSAADFRNRFNQDERLGDEA